MAVEWQLNTPVESSDSLPVSLEFYAAQFRGNDDASDEHPNQPEPWEDDDRCAVPEESGPHPDISFVAFCGTGLSPDVVSLRTQSTDGRVTAVDWTLDDVSGASIETVVLKYDTRFEIFEQPPTVVRVGEGDWVESVFESERTPARPCLDGSCTLKYEVEEAAWESRGCELTDGDDE